MAHIEIAGAGIGGMAMAYAMREQAGPRLPFDAIERPGPVCNTQSICDVDHGGTAGKAWDQFVKDPGSNVGSAGRRQQTLIEGSRTMHFPLPSGGAANTRAIDNVFLFS